MAEQDVQGARIFLKGIKAFQDAKEASAMTDPADIIAGKLSDLDELTDGDGFTYSWFDMDREDLARELAAALTAAGFGLVADAGAKALDDAADVMDKSAEALLMMWGDMPMNDAASATLSATRHEARRVRARAAAVRGER